MERMTMSISKTIKKNPRCSKKNITHVMEALGPKGEDLDEKENGKDVLLIKKSKKPWLQVGTPICFSYL